MRLAYALAYAQGAKQLLKQFWSMFGTRLCTCLDTGGSKYSGKSDIATQKKTSDIATKTRFSAPDLILVSLRTFSEKMQLLALCRKSCTQSWFRAHPIASENATGRLVHKRSRKPMSHLRPKMPISAWMATKMTLVEIKSE